MNSIATYAGLGFMICCTAATGSAVAGSTTPLNIAIPTVARVYVPPPLDTLIFSAIISPDTMIPTILGVTRRAPAGYSAAGAVSLGLADIVVGSGFVKRFVPPIPVGLLIIGGQEINPINQSGYHSIIVIRDNRLKLQTREEFKKKNVTGALQTGPWLVRNSEVVISEKVKNRGRLATRAFVCEKLSGELMIGLTKGKVSLNDLADYLANTERACVNATNLAGGGSETLVRRDDDKLELFGNAKFRQASLIGFKTRSILSSRLRTGTGIFGAVASEGTRSYDSREFGGGVFTHFISRGLEDKADLNLDGTVTARELKIYASEAIARYTLENFDVAQNPIFTQTGDLLAISGVDANYERVMGVVVGISKYRNPVLSNQYGARNAIRIFETFASLNGGNTFQLHLLINSQARRSDIFDRLQLVRSLANEQTLTVFYFSGHSFLDPSGAAYLMPFDSDIGKIESMIRFRRLRWLLDKVPGSKAYFLDSYNLGRALIDK